ncbi:MAG: protein kinase domain-containing protein [Chthoniobacterales bacterium]
MNSERWQSCTEIFHRAVQQAPRERAAILERSCHGDEPLRRRVELLLKYHDNSGDFIAAPAAAVAPAFRVADPEALIGQQLGSYRLDAVAGIGGMGVVYSARDERLGRKVALKLLPLALAPNADELERLRHEARTASALNHPNIVTIHEIGEADSTHYVATEFVEGSTLRERMREGVIAPVEALDIARQVASALDVAHRAGIVHRDIKPENIILRPDGFLKVLDFGIAAVDRPRTTEPGKVLGTARYMSPEQARGETVDGRSDLWSLGVVLYEMLARRVPFEGATPAKVVAEILRAELPPLRERALQSVVERCLRKKPDERFQSAAEMLAALRALENKIAGHRAGAHGRWIGLAAVVALLVSCALFFLRREGPADLAPAAAAPEKSIAILPFENLSADPDSAFLADGLHDDVVTSLAKIKDLKVIARGSVVGYRGAAQAGKLREIGAALGVAHLLQGSVRRAGNELVVNVALVDPRNQQQEWAQHYERPFGGALRLQGELVVDLARELRSTLTPMEASGAAEPPTRNPNAYLLYLRARKLELTAFPKHVQAAMSLYQQAVELDPKFALAHARLSLCPRLLANWEPGSAWAAKARAEAEEAQRLRPDLGEAWLASAQYYLWCEQDNARARDELARAAELLPNSAEVLVAGAFIDKRQNRYRARIAALERAESLDPMNRLLLDYLINTYRWTRRWPDALQTFDRCVALGGDQVIPGGRWRRANDEFQMTGDIHVLKKAIVESQGGGDDWRNLARYETAMLERDYPAAARSLAAVPPAAWRELPLPFTAHSRAFEKALLAVAGQTPAKQETLLKARNTTEPSRDFDLALLDAFLGQKEKAVREARQARDQTLGPAGSIEKNQISSALAMIYAQTSEPDKAITLIEHLLTVPCELQSGTIYDITLTNLKWRWQWDPLRSDPRFQRIVAAPAPATVY